MTQNTYRTIVALFAMAVVLTAAAPARAQHGDYLLGTAGGISGADQPPEGVYYSIGPLKCGPLNQHPRNHQSPDLCGRGPGFRH